LLARAKADHGAKPARPSGIVMVEDPWAAALRKAKTAG
jgi:hypothetical protein